MAKAIYVKRERLKRKGIDLSGYPSAGPWPNITGMKNKFWGKDALIIRSGAYIYNVPKEIYDQFSSEVG